MKRIDLDLGHEIYLAELRIEEQSFDKEYFDQYTDDLKRLKRIEAFINDVFEIAFGDDASEKGYTAEEVLEQLKQYAEESSDLFDLVTANYNSVDDFIQAKIQYLEGE